MPLYPHPYLTPFDVTMKLLVNIATIVWACIILIQTRGFANTAYAPVADCVDEDRIALAVTAIAVGHLMWLALELPPRRWWMFGYLVLLIAWSAVLFVVCISSPLRATAVPTVGVTTVVAFLAFVLGPKDRRAVTYQ